MVIAQVGMVALIRQVICGLPTSYTDAHSHRPPCLLLRSGTIIPDSVELSSQWKVFISA